MIDPALESVIPNLVTITSFQYYQFLDVLNIYRHIKQ